MANTENIEAKLCAYVDGELDEAGRAEIEAHLASNAQHRQLIEELRAQRSLLARLPRVAAPEDIGESINARLERSVLLDDIDADEDHAALRINRWPQYVLAASVVFLALGLGAVIYMVLPPHGESARYAANATADLAPATKPTFDSSIASRGAGSGAGGSGAAGGPGGLPVESETLEKTGGAGRGESIAMKKSVEEPPSVASKPAAPNDVFSRPLDQPLANSGTIVTNSSGGGAFNNIFADAAADPQIARQLKNAKDGPPEKPLLVVMNCRDPSAANEQVTQYLRANRIRWEELPEPMPQPITSRDDIATASRLNRQQMMLKTGAAPPPAATTPAASERDQDRSTGIAEASPTPQPLAKALPEQRQEQQNARPSGPTAAATVPPPAPLPTPAPAPPGLKSSAATTEPTALAAAPPASGITDRVDEQKAQTMYQSAGQNAVQAPEQVVAQAQASRPEQQQMQQSTGGARSKRTIVAYGITRAQISELNLVAQREPETPQAAIKQQEARARLLDDVRKEQAPATWPAKESESSSSTAQAMASPTQPPTTMPADGVAATTEQDLQNKAIAKDKLATSGPSGADYAGAFGKAGDAHSQTRDRKAPQASPAAAAPPPASPPMATAPEQQQRALESKGDVRGAGAAGGRFGQSSMSPPAAEGKSEPSTRQIDVEMADRAAPPAGAAAPAPTAAAPTTATSSQAIATPSGEIAGVAGTTTMPAPAAPAAPAAAAATGAGAVGGAPDRVDVVILVQNPQAVDLVPQAAQNGPAEVGIPSQAGSQPPSSEPAMSASPAVSPPPAPTLHPNEAAAPSSAEPPPTAPATSQPAAAPPAAAPPAAAPPAAAPPAASSPAPAQ